MTEQLDALAADPWSRGRPLSMFPDLIPEAIAALEAAGAHDVADRLRRARTDGVRLA